MQTDRRGEHQTECPFGTRMATETTSTVFYSEVFLPLLWYFGDKSEGQIRLDLK